MSNIKVKRWMPIKKNGRDDIDNTLLANATKCVITKKGADQDFQVTIAQEGFIAGVKDFLGHGPDDPNYMNKDGRYYFTGEERYNIVNEGKSYESLLYLGAQGGVYGFKKPG